MSKIKSLRLTLCAAISICLNGGLWEDCCQAQEIEIESITQISGKTDASDGGWVQLSLVDDLFNPIPRQTLEIRNPNDPDYIRPVILDDQGNGSTELNLKSGCHTLEISFSGSPGYRSSHARFKLCIKKTCKIQPVIRLSQPPLFPVGHPLEFDVTESTSGCRLPFRTHAVQLKAGSDSLRVKIPTDPAPVHVKLSPGNTIPGKVTIQAVDISTRNEPFESQTTHLDVIYYDRLMESLELEHEMSHLYIRAIPSSAVKPYMPLPVRMQLCQGDFCEDASQIGESTKFEVPSAIGGTQVQVNLFLGEEPVETYLIDLPMPRKSGLMGGLSLLAWSLGGLFLATLCAVGGHFIRKKRRRQKHLKAVPSLPETNLRAVENKPGKALPSVSPADGRLFIIHCFNVVCQATLDMEFQWGQQTPDEFYARAQAAKIRHLDDIREFCQCIKSAAFGPDPLSQDTLAHIRELCLSLISKSG